MALSNGSRIGPYEILSAIGAGGMGEVYRARDTKLGREVALKILPEAFSADAQRMARFRREAQLLASLNQSNVASIYGFEDSGATHALVMELVEGPTLADRIKQGAIPLDEALPIAEQIAGGLEYAHERSIVHRDLKPSNIKIAASDAVKILDFGLAKALEGDSSAVDISSSPTISRMATQAGIILGTAAYMSPEQAKGKSVDRRTDVWSFGCVLYEMLTGKMPFTGETVTDTLAAVIRAEPDWSQLPAATPQTIRILLQRCLKKDPRHRLQSIGDARIAIEETISGIGEIHESPLKSEPGGHRSLRQRVLFLLFALCVISAVALGGWWYGRRSAAAKADWAGELLPGPTIAFGPRAAPGGRLLAFQALVDNMTQVGELDPNSGDWNVLTHDRTHGLIAHLSWSHDGSSIYFDRLKPLPVGIYSVPALGGEVREIMANAASPEALPDGSLLVVRVDPDRKNQIYRYWPGSGHLQALGAWLSLIPSAPLRVFPDGKAAVFYGTIKSHGSDDSPHLYVLDIATDTFHRLAPKLPIVLPSQLFPLAVTPDGRSVLIDLPAGSLHRIVAIPRTGASTFRTLLTLTSPPWFLDVAPDGSLYVDQIDRPLETLQIAPSGGIPNVLASIESYSYEPSRASVELPDGRLVLSALISGRPRLLVGRQGESFLPLLQTGEEASPPLVGIAQDEIAFVAGTPPNQSLAIASVKQGRILTRFPATEGHEIDDVAASPDGRDLYYVSSGTVWSVPSRGGSPRKICTGDGVAVPPNGNSLIVNLFEAGGVRLERVPLPRGPAQPIQVKGDLSLSQVPLATNALDTRGQLAVSIAPKDSWFFGLGILNVATGSLTRVPLKYTGDIMSPEWTADGRILASGYPFGAHIWHFRRLTGSGKH